MSTNDYTIRFIPELGNQSAHADTLSRVPLPELVSSVPTPPELILIMEMLQVPSVKA